MLHGNRYYIVRYLANGKGVGNTENVQNNDIVGSVDAGGFFLWGGGERSCNFG